VKTSVHPVPAVLSREDTKESAKMPGSKNGIKMSRYKIMSMALGLLIATALPSFAAPSDSVFVARESRLETMILRATKEKDIILLNCLHSELVELKRFHRIGTDSDTAAAKARAQENSDLEEHYFAKVKIVEEQSLKIFAQALLCVGMMSDKTIVRVIVTRPEVDIPENPSPPDYAGPRPPDASPFD